MGSSRVNEERQTVFKTTRWSSWLRARGKSVCEDNEAGASIERREFHFLVDFVRLRQAPFTFSVKIARHVIAREIFPASTKKNRFKISRSESGRGRIVSILYGCFHYKVPRYYVCWFIWQACCLLRTDERALFHFLQVLALRNVKINSHLALDREASGKFAETTISSLHICQERGI